MTTEAADLTASTTFLISESVGVRTAAATLNFFIGAMSRLKTSNGTDMCTGRARLTDQLAKAVATTSEN